MQVHSDKPDAFKKCKSMGGHETLHRRSHFFSSTGSVPKESSLWTDILPESSSTSSVSSVSSANSISSVSFAPSVNSASTISCSSSITSVFPDMTTTTPNTTAHNNDDGTLLELGRVVPESNSICSWTTASGSDQLDGLEGYDNDWLTEENYDLNSWKSLPNIKLGVDINGNGLLDADPAAGTFEEIFNSLCRPDELLSAVPIESAPTGAFHPESIDHRLLPEYFALQIPHFQVMRPGNPTSVTVFSGHTSSDVTFCNTFSRVASYVQ